MSSSSSPHTSVRPWLAAALAVTALLVVPAVAGAADWNPYPAQSPALISAPSGGIDVAAAPDGSTTFASVHAGGDAASVLEVTHVSPTHAWSWPTVVGDASVAPPVTAVSASGLTAVAWRGREAAGQDPLQVVVLGANGAPGPVHTVANVQPAATFDRRLAVAVDDGGNATVVWRAHNPGHTTDAVWARRVSADGTLGPLNVLGDAGQNAAPSVAVTPGGVAWITWTDEVEAPTAAWAARLDTAGQVDMPRQQVSDPGVSVGDVGLAASAAGGVVVWTEEGTSPYAKDGHALHFRGVRLPVSGALAGSSVQSEPFFDPDPRSAPPAIGPDGTITLVFTATRPNNGQSQIAMSRIAPGDDLSLAVPLGRSADGIHVYAPMLAAAPNGALLVTWIYNGLGPAAPLGSWVMSSVPIAPDGTAGPLAISGHAHYPANDYPDEQTVLRADGVGGGQLAYISQLGTADVKLQAQYLGTAPVPPPPPPAVKRVSAALKLSTVSRTGAKLSLRGRISAKATGKVTVTYARRIGRKVVTGKTSAKIVKGRWSVTLKLKRRTATLPRATVTVSYPGNAATLPAKVKRTLKASKPKHRATKHRR